MDPNLAAYYQNAGLLAQLGGAQSQQNANAMAALAALSQAGGLAGFGGMQGFGAVATGHERPRSRSPRRGGGGLFGPGGDDKEGDWYCPGCADRQFRKNATCRNCGTPREQGVQSLNELGDPLNIFLKNQSIQPHVEAQLRSLSPDMQKMVIERGSLHGARDPTAVLIKRMNELNCPRQGDWYCTVCHDLQFARNANCRGCGAVRSAVEAPEGTPTMPTAEEFLANFDIDPDKRAKFFMLDPSKQAAVIAKGTLAGARDPTAVLVTRMKQVTEGGNFSGGSKSKGSSKGGGEDPFQVGFRQAMEMMMAGGGTAAAAVTAWQGNQQMGAAAAQMGAAQSSGQMGTGFW